MSSPGVDEPIEVRSGEEVDVEALARWVREHVDGLEGTPSLRQFPGGHSNLTYCLSFGERELVMRRPPFGSRVATAHDMSREHRILSRLHTVYPKAPQALALCEDPEVIGAPFYVMERVRGVILRKQRPPRGVELSPSLMRALSEATADTLAELHAVDPSAAGLEELGRPEGYVRRQVEGWARRYHRARTDEISDMERVARWLTEHLPPERGAALIHGDYKYDNLVLDPDDLGTIRAILDWEMATVGDPLMDLGTTLAYWIEPGDPEALRAFPFGPTALEGNLGRSGFVERYAARSGREVGDVLFYFVFGLFKVAVIAQQIYARFHAGHTSDPRFAAMIVGVTLLAALAARAIDTGRIDRLTG